MPLLQPRVSAVSTARTPLGNCPGCGYKIDCATSVDGDSDVLPSPNDFTVCLDCGHICRFNEDLTLRSLNDEDRNELNSIPELKFDLARVSILIFLMSEQRKKTLGLYKIQRPLAGDMTKIMVYDEGRRNFNLGEFNEKIKKMFEEHGNPAKMYVKAYIINGELVIDSIPSNQEYNW